MVPIVEATTPEQIEQARSLFLEYAASLGFSLGYQGFDEELAALPGRYSPPTGCLLLADAAGAAAGCVALREIDPAPHGRTCEMKRLYIRPAYRGTGLGRALTERIVERGRALGYAAMRLDTSEDMHAARHIYSSLGFRPIERYNNDPHGCTIYLELRYT
jgi:putative acetyltransferase